MKQMKARKTKEIDEINWIVFFRGRGLGPSHNPPQEQSTLCELRKRRKKEWIYWREGLLGCACLPCAEQWRVAPPLIHTKKDSPTLPLQLFSLFLMALQRANKREIELSGLAASLWARWCGASFIPEERGCGTLSFHCFISFHNSIQELPSLFLHSSPLTNQSHAGLLVSFLG